MDVKIIDLAVLCYQMNFLCYLDLIFEATFDKTKI